jgi:hypothetical protein
MDSPFSLELSEEVVQVRDWVHEFADTVIRPAAAEWDEREETPWPIIQEAAKVGLYTPDLFAQMAPPNPVPALTSGPSAPERGTTKPPMSGSSTAPRLGRPTVESPMSTWWWHRWNPS